jgi:hypothetical protein
LLAASLPLLGQMANQRVLAVEQRARLLQQFGEVQHIGQDALRSR